MDTKHEQLWRDCVNGEDSNVEEAIDSGTHPDWTNPKINDMSLVHAAITYGHEKMVKMLLDKGADPNKRDKNGQTPLMTAASDGQQGIVDVLLSKLADIKAMDNNDDTALHKAAMNSHRAVVKLLLDNGADIEAKNKAGNTPLHLAAEGGQTLVVILLLDRGAKVISRNEDGKIPKELAEKNKRPCCVDELQKLEHMRKQQALDALLWTAVKSGSEKQVSNFLKEGANPNWHNPANYEYTSVEIAVMYGNIRCLSILLHEGRANPNGGVDNKLGLPGLHFAAKESGKEAVKAAKLLLANGAKVDYTDPDGQTALHVATSRGHADMVEYLCKSRISIDAQDKDGDTAIHIAARHGRAQIIKILVAYSANRQLQNKDKKTPLDVANDSGQLIIADQLNANDTDNDKDKKKMEFAHEHDQVTPTDQPKTTSTHKKRSDKEELLLLRSLYRNVTEQFEDWFKNDNFKQHSGDELEEAKQKILQLEEELLESKSNVAEQQDSTRDTTQQLTESVEDSEVSNAANALALPQRTTTKSIAIQASYLDIAPKLRGVEVCGETVFEVLADSLPQNLVWPGYGFNIEIPAGAFPPGVTASVAVRAILKGQFSLPENSELVSAIYWISCSENLLKNVAVNIQHCAQISSEEESRKFKFIIAECSQGPPYKFAQRDGVFKARTQYATIQCKRFSILGILGFRPFKNTYIALKFLKHIPNSVNMKFRFAVLTDLSIKVNEYKKQMIEEQWKENDDYQHIKFQNDSITLDIPRTPPKIVGNWKIVPQSPLRIDKADVQKHHDVDKSRWDDVLAPCCNIQLQWIGPKNAAVTDLQHAVAIKGTTVPGNFFTISYYPSKEGDDEQEIITEPQILSRQDLLKLIDELQDVTECRNLGLHLGLKPAELNVVERENSSVADRKTAILDRWLQSNTEAAWEDVVSALKKMKKNRVAKCIQEKYCDGGDIHAADEHEEFSVVRKRIRSHNETFDIVAEEHTQPRPSQCGYLALGILLFIVVISVVVVVLLWLWFY